MTLYRRGPGGPMDAAMAAAAGLLAGSIVFYIARVWLRREVVGVGERRGALENPDDGSGDDDGPGDEVVGGDEGGPGEDDLPPDGEARAAPPRRSDPAPS